MVLLNRKSGFTLIELLVVISIIGLLAAVVLVSLNSSRAKARDARKISDFNQISKALNLFYDANGRMPNNYFTYGINNEVEGGGNYEQSMQELITAGLLSAIPKSPGVGRLYSYYNYGANNNIGALLVTQLETYPPSTTGVPPSFRLNWGGPNWCDINISSTDYCISNPY